MFEGVASSIDEVLCGGPSPHPCGAHVDALQRQRNRLDYAMATEVAAFDRDRAWSVDGAYNAVTWIATTLRIPRREAATLVRVGCALADMPATAAAWAAGDIGLAQADILAALLRPVTAEAFTRDEADLVAEAARRTEHQFRAATKTWDEHHDPERADKLADKQFEDRAVHLSQSYEDHWFLDGTLDPISGLIVADELRRLERKLFREDWKETKKRLGHKPSPDELPRSAAQRRHDALVEMATRSRAKPKGTRKPEPLFIVTLGYERFQQLCELHNRRVASLGALTRWLPKAWVERVVFDPAGRPLEVGRGRRLFSKAQARAIRTRDQECTHDKCDRPAIDLIPGVSLPPVSPHTGRVTEPMPAYGPTCDTPIAHAAMVHWWDDLTFLHWRVDPADVQRLLPAGLTAETFDGTAWVGLVPFFLRVGLPVAPSMPWFSRFAETNVRTYVRGMDGARGIWFFSLDAARLGAVVTARASYRIPYFWSQMSIAHDGPVVTYECRRRWPGPRGASSRAVIEIGDAYAPGELTELDHFLTARWALYSSPRSTIRKARAFHDPWPLRRATAIDVHDELIAAAGFPTPVGEPLVHYSPSVEVRIGWPARVRPS